MAVGRTNVTTPAVIGKNVTYSVYTSNYITRGDLVQLVDISGTVYVTTYTSGPTGICGGIALKTASAGQRCLVRIPLEVNI